MKGRHMLITTPGKLDQATGGKTAGASKRVNDASKGAGKTVSDAQKQASDGVSKAGKNVTDTGSGAMNDVTDMGKETWGAISKGDVMGAGKGIASGTGKTVGNVGSGAQKTVGDAGDGANKLVSGAGKNLGEAPLLTYRLKRTMLTLSRRYCGRTGGEPGW